MHHNVNNVIMLGKQVQSKKKTINFIAIVTIVKAACMITNLILIIVLSMSPNTTMIVSFLFEVLPAEEKVVDIVPLLVVRLLEVEVKSVVGSVECKWEERCLMLYHFCDRW